MISLTNIIEDIREDFSKKQYKDSHMLNRRFVLSKGNVVVISLNKKTWFCEVWVEIPGDTSTEELNALPKWKGMEGKTIINVEGRSDVKYISFEQLEGYDPAIFVNVMQDICDDLEYWNKSKCVTSIKNTLQKWSVFFRFEKDYALSANAQQGLYGELWILEKFIKRNGPESLRYWAGYNSEAHDFYVGRDAIEVKSSSAKGPERVKINNEFQLDETGVVGFLYLLYLKMKKSEIDGENLPQIVGRVMNLLNQAQRDDFKDKLLRVGYVHAMPELYNNFFRVREESCFTVKDDFPRITSKNISKGIGAVEYVLSLDACNSYMIEVESFYKGVDYQ